MIYIIYHNQDNDGKLAGWLVTQYLRQIGKRFKLIGMNYADPTPDEIFRRWQKDDVYVLDFSLPVKDMNRLGTRLIWCDHHGTAINDPDMPRSVRGFRSVDKSGCSLTYEWLTVVLEWSYWYGPIRQVIGWVNAHDMWDHSAKEAWYFYLASRAFETDPSVPEGDSFWSLSADRLPTLCYVGEHMYKVEIANAQRLVRNGDYTNCLGHKAFVVNTLLHPMLSESVDWTKCDILVAYTFEHGVWRYNLRAKGKVHVGELAKKYGGGGHANAAGFTSKERLVK